MRVSEFVKTDAPSAKKLRPLVKDTYSILHKALSVDKKILFEGAQGTLLDIDHGTYPFVTSSNPTGGEGEKISLDDKTTRIAIQTAKALKCDVCAVDILESQLGPLVLEPNLSPGLSGISKITEIDVADEIAKYLFQRAKEFSQKGRDIATNQMFDDLGMNNKELGHQLISNLDFRADRILLPKIATDISKLSNTDETIIKVEKGKIIIEKM